jgi:hypothetical protein
MDLDLGLREDDAGQEGIDAEIKKCASVRYG